MFLGMYTGQIIVYAFGSVLYSSKGLGASSIGWLSAMTPLSVLVVVPPVAYVVEVYDLQQPFLLGGIVIGAITVTIMCWSMNQAAVVAAAVIHTIAVAPVPPLADEHAMGVIGPERRESYGAFRCWGAYGWATAAVVMSLLVDAGGWRWATLVWYLGFGLAAFSIHQTPVKKVTGEHRMIDVAKYVLKHPRIVLWLFAMSCIGLGYSLIGTFLFLFLESLEAPKILLGLSIVFTVLVEIPLFQNSKKLHSKLSNRALLLCAVAGWVVRVIGYSLLQNPWYVLFLEPLHGITFGFMWLSGINFFSNAFPPQLSNSAIGLLHATSFGVGPTIGNIVGGYAYEGLGPRAMFQVAAMAMLVVGVLFYLLDVRLDHWDKLGQRDTDEVGVGATASDNRSFPPLTPRPSMQCESERHEDSHHELQASADHRGPPTVA